MADAVQGGAGGALVPVQGHVPAAAPGAPVGGVVPAGGDSSGLDYRSDIDVPIHQSGYDFSQAPGSASMNVHDRDWVDAFLPFAHAAGFGQQRLRDAIGYALTMGHKATEAGFREYAHKRGWPEAHIALCLKFYRQHKK